MNGLVQTNLKPHFIPSPRIIAGKNYSITGIHGVTGIYSRRTVRPYKSTTPDIEYFLPTVSACHEYRTVSSDQQSEEGSQAPLQ